IYCSDEVHTSIDRAIWIAGVGQENLVRIPTEGPNRSLDIKALEQAIERDLANGLVPAGIIGCVGGTSVGAVDDIASLAETSRKYALYCHVDAAWAGSAMICPEFRTYWRGVDGVDSIVLNPHKWLGAQFDCSAHFLRAPELVAKTLSIKPDYLKTHGRDGVVNYSEMSVPLGRRFRALKLWFLMRAHGLEGLRTMIRNHVAWSEALAQRLANEPDFELVTQPMLSLFSFRHLPADGRDIEHHTLSLLTTINDAGAIYLTPTKVDGRTAIRFQVGQFDTTQADVDAAFEVITRTARALG
ncbi:MAG: pyridoxal-dependent decarboxylase, partial [Pseudomonadota bacterium]